MASKKAVGTLPVMDPGGVHNRAIARVNRRLEGLDADVSITAKGKTIQQREGRFSPLETLSLAAVKGTELTITAEGPDAASSLDHYCIHHRGGGIRLVED